MKKILLIITLLFISLIIPSCTLETNGLFHYKYVDATCTKDGHIEYYYNENEDIYYNKDKEAISIDDITINKTGHNYPENYDEDDYITFFYCNKCHEYYRNDPLADVLKDNITEYDQEACDELIDKGNAICQKIADNEVIDIEELNTLYKEIVSMFYKVKSIGEYIYLENYKYYTEETHQKIYNTEMTLSLLESVSQKIISTAYDSSIKDSFLNLTYFTQSDLNTIERDIEIFRNEDLTNIKLQISDYNQQLNILSNKDSSEIDSNELSNIIYESVQLKNQLAVIYGYDNYYEYASKTIYGRDYSSKDVLNFCKYLSQYFISLFKKINYSSTGVDWEYLQSVMGGSLRPSSANIIVDYFKTITNGTNVNMYETMNDAMKNGRIVNGVAMGAYAANLSDGNIMFIGFGDDQMSMDFIHEAGHYNFSFIPGIYAYDLLETHSQTNELLFLSYVYNIMKDVDIVTANYMLNDYLDEIKWKVFHTALEAIFEISIITNYYDGDDKFKDGIDASEYKDLYQAISVDYFDGAYKDRYEYLTPYYCGESLGYSIAYAISLVGSMGVLEYSFTNYEEAVQRFIKTYTYFDDPVRKANFTYQNVIEYAGMCNPFDSESMKQLAESLDKFFFGE